MPSPHLTINEILKDLSDELGIPTLPYRYEILMYLAGSDRILADQFLEIFRGSRSLFHQIMAELHDIGIATTDRPDADGRLRGYRLTDDARPGILMLFALLPQWLEEKLERQTVRPGMIATVSRNIKAATGAIISSPSYEILLNLFDAPDQSAGELLAFSSYSPTTFYQALAEARDKRLVVRHKLSSDRRKTVYRLTDKTHAILTRNLWRVLNTIPEFEAQQPKAKR